MGEHVSSLGTADVRELWGAFSHHMNVRNGVANWGKCSLGRGRVSNVAQQLNAGRLQSNSPVLREDLYGSPVLSWLQGFYTSVPAFPPWRLPLHRLPLLGKLTRSHHNLLHWQACVFKWVSCISDIYTKLCIVHVNLTSCLSTFILLTTSLDPLLLTRFSFFVLFCLIWTWKSLHNNKGVFACLFTKPSSFSCQKIHKYVDFASRQAFGRWIRWIFGKSLLWGILMNEHSFLLCHNWLALLNLMVKTSPTKENLVAEIRASVLEMRKNCYRKFVYEWFCPKCWYNLLEGYNKTV